MRQLKLQDNSAHPDFALNFLARMQVDEYWPSHILLTDEIHFHLVREYTELLHMGFYESSCCTTTTIAFPVRHGMVWIHLKFHFRPLLLQRSHNEWVC